MINIVKLKICNYSKNVHIFIKCRDNRDIKLCEQTDLVTRTIENQDVPSANHIYVLQCLW